MRRGWHVRFISLSTIVRESEKPIVMSYAQLRSWHLIPFWAFLLLYHLFDEISMYCSIVRQFGMERADQHVLFTCCYDVSVYR